MPNRSQTTVRFPAPILVAAALLGTLSTLAFADPFRVGLVLDKAGKDDKSFNASAYEGAKLAEKELKIQLKTVEAADNNSFETLQRGLAEKKFDLIIGIGFSQGDAMKKVTAQFPDRHFAIVDADIAAPNLRALLFEEHEGSFLAGALAALTSKTHHVGFVGGMDVPLIRRFALGYEAGAHYVDPKAVVTENYVGVTGQAFNNPPRGKELALTQFRSGADVIFAAAGASGLGVFDAAEETKKFAIGCDSNQNWVKPGYVLSSMLKRVDKAVYSVIKDAQAGKFTAGSVRFGVASQGIDLAMDENNKKLISRETLAKLEQIKQAIVAKKISVPDYYLKNAKR